MEKWPNCFIIGAPRAGTTSLHTYLSRTPGVFMSEIKEPNHFDVNPTYHLRDPYKNKFKDKKEYLSLFKDVKEEKIVGESSATYLSDTGTPSLIHQIVPHAKIILSLRDPVERAYSHYHLRKLNRKIKSSFHDYIQSGLKEEKIPYTILRWGLYSDDVQRYLDVFGKDQVKIIIFEEFIKDMKKTLEEVLLFLGMNQTIENFEGEAFNAYSISRGGIQSWILRSRPLSNIAKKMISPKRRKFLKEKLIDRSQSKPEMNLEDRDILINFYKDDVQRLQTVLGRKFPWPNF